MNSFGGDKLIFRQGKDISREINTFLKNDPILDARSIYDFLLFGTTLPPHSPLKDVSIFFPGELENGNNLYTELDVDVKNLNIAEFVDLFDNLLETYFGKFSGNKNTVLLSGGIDSAIILSYLGKDTTCLTWGGWGEESTDVKYSKVTAERFGVENHLFTYAEYEKDTELYKETVKNLKIPLLFFNSVPFVRMASLAKEHGITDWFMGQNADTVLISYPPSVSVRRLSSLNKYIKLSNFYPFDDRKKFLFSTSSTLRLFAYFKSNGIFPGKWINLPDKYFEEKEEIIKKYLYPKNLSQEIILTEEFMTEARRNQICQNEIPLKYGIEVYCPYYTEEFVKVALSIPDSIRRKNSYDKVVFKELAKKRGVPREIIEKGKKGLSYGHRGIFDKGMHIPIWNKMQNDDFLNMFIDIKAIRERNQEDFLIFDTLRSLFYYGELVVRPNNIKF